MAKSSAISRGHLSHAIRYFLSGVAALALIVLAVLFARYRKRQQAVVALLTDVATAEQARLDAEAQNKELKESLARAQRTVDEVVSSGGAELKQCSIKFADLTFLEEIGHGSHGPCSRRSRPFSLPHNVSLLFL